MMALEKVTYDLHSHFCLSSHSCVMWLQFGWWKAGFHLQLVAASYGHMIMICNLLLLISGEITHWGSLMTSIKCVIHLMASIQFVIKFATSIIYSRNSKRSCGCKSRITWNLFLNIPWTKTLRHVLISDWRKIIVNTDYVHMKYLPKNNWHKFLHS